MGYWPKINTKTVLQDHPLAVALGQKAEELFPILFAQQTGKECIKATDEQQSRHIDYVCEGWSFEVKSRKKKKRHDPQFCDDEMLLEITNSFQFEIGRAHV